MAWTTYHIAILILEMIFPDIVNNAVLQLEEEQLLLHKSHQLLLEQNLL